MISQRCPACDSSRIRRGYRPTRFWSKLMLRYNLLCDNCNWEFVGFALPGFISTKQTKSSKERRERGKTAHSDSLTGDNEFGKNANNESGVSPRPKIRKKVKIRA